MISRFDDLARGPVEVRADGGDFSTIDGEIAALLALAIDQDSAADQEIVARSGHVEVKFCRKPQSVPMAASMSAKSTCSSG